MLGEVGAAQRGRVTPGAMNYGVSTNQGSFDSHSALWSDQTVRNNWERFFQKWYSSRSNSASTSPHGGGGNPNPPAPPVHVPILGVLDDIYDKPNALDSQSR
jgi:hypothetical protein